MERLKNCAYPHTVSMLAGSGVRYEINTKSKIAAKLGAQVRIGALGESMQACGPDFLHEAAELSLP